MAMGVQVNTAVQPALSGGARWNPLRCGGLELPTNLVIMVKAIAIALLLTRHFLLLPDPFLPFIPGMDLIPGAWFQRGMQALMVGAAVALLLNVRVRLTSFLLGMSLLLSVVASKAYYGNNKTFCGLILLLASLHQPGRSPWMLRLQLVVVYFGAGLNKLLDPDWRSGVFSHHWVANRLHQPLFLALEPLLPPLALAKMMSWLTIGTELGLSVAFLIRRLYPLGIWLSILLHSGMLLFTGSTFTLFFYGMTAAMLVFVDWPAEPLTVIYDGDCGFCDATRRFFERLDLEDAFLWLPSQRACWNDSASPRTWHASASTWWRRPRAWRFSRIPEHVAVQPGSVRGDLCTACRARTARFDIPQRARRDSARALLTAVHAGG